MLLGGSEVARGSSRLGVQYDDPSDEFDGNDLVEHIDYEDARSDGEEAALLVHGFAVAQSSEVSSLFLLCADEREWTHTD